MTASSGGPVADVCTCQPVGLGTFISRPPIYTVQEAWGPVARCSACNGVRVMLGGVEFGRVTTTVPSLPVAPITHEAEATSPTPTAGIKFDGGKLRWSLLPRGVVSVVLRVLEIGAKKYTVDNWRLVPDARRRYYDAVNRHVEAWWSGEDTDPDTGEPHLACAICSLMFLLGLKLEGRPNGGPEDPPPQV